jgi:hypothetical protein
VAEIGSLQSGLARARAMLLLGLSSGTVGAEENGRKWLFFYRKWLFLGAFYLGNGGKMGGNG